VAGFRHGKLYPPFILSGHALRKPITMQSIATIILLFLGILCCFSLNAQQTGTIRGQVQDSTHHPMDGAIVSLLQAGDSSLVRTHFTEADGQFEFNGLSFGTYLLQVSNAGYRTWRSTVQAIDTLQPNALMPAILLQNLQSATAIQEVKITANIPLIERRIDRTVMNVDALLSNAGSNAFEMLEKAPGVSTDQNGGLMLKGKGGVLVFIDDKPTYLSGTDLENYLKSLPANLLSQIEIMTNPPAKYDAAGNVGIINIVTKKNKVKGFNAQVSANYNQGRYAKTSDSYSFNYRNNQLNFFGNGSFSYYKGYNDLIINRTYKNADGSIASTFRQQTDIVYQMPAAGMRLGLDYYIHPKTTLGVTVNGLVNESKSPILNTSILRDPNENLTGVVIAHNAENEHFRNTGFNLNMRHNFDSTGRQLALDADYIIYNTGSRQSYINDSYDAGGAQTARDELTGNLPSDIRIYAFKADYTHPLANNAQFEAGMKTSYTTTDNRAAYFNTIAGEPLPDYEKSNHFKYGEQIHAGYLNFNKSWKRFGFQSGLRAEQTISDGNQLGNPEKAPSRFTRNYFSLFPTAYLSYKLDSAANNQLVLSFGRRIDRPYYEDLNPFLRPLDKFTFYTGNPYLKPTFSNNIELTYSYKSFLNLTWAYSQTTNEIAETIEIDAAGIYFSRPGNIGSSKVMVISADATIPVAKWLTTTIYTEFDYLHYRSALYTETLNARGTFGFISIINRIKMKHDWSAEISMRYRSETVSTQFLLGDMGFVNVGVQKKVLKGKGTIRVNVNDVFHSQINRGKILNLRQTDADYRNKYDSRTVSFTFTYNFGKPFEAAEHSNGGSETEQNRVKN